MKEYDYTKWDNKPREMWVWNGDESNKNKRLVVYIRDNDIYPVLVKDGSGYKHCAEIKQTRRMTNYELAHWLWEGTQVGEFREYTYIGDGKESSLYCNLCCTHFGYYNDDASVDVDVDIKIRVNGGEWKEPFIEE